jgi:hypothetical protein
VVYIDIKLRSKTACSDTARVGIKALDKVEKVRKIKKKSFEADL